jgi:hypothetical protein
VIQQRFSSLALATPRGVEWQVVWDGTRCCHDQIGWSPYEDEYREAGLALHLPQKSCSCALVRTRGRLIRVIPLF